MPTVALDIGHGSDTYDRTGGKGVVHNGRVYEEHDANSDTTLRTKEMLEAHGIDVWLPQPAYAPEVWLTERTNEANRRGVDLYWSTHYNAGIPAAHGVCSFYWYTSDAARKLATSFAKNAESAGLATHGDGTHASKRGSWTNLHVCRETAMTAVLTENGFMTSDIDFPGVFGRNKDEYHQRIAEVHAKSICEFFGIKFDENQANSVKHVEHETKTKGAMVQLLLNEGDRGADVRELQKKLKARGFYDGNIDGIYGGKTESAVREFQRKYGLQVDGIAGPKTLGKLEALESNTAVFTLNGRTFKVKEVK